MDENLELAASLFDLNIEKVRSISEVSSSARKAIEDKNNVFIDFRNQNVDQEETKKFIEGMRRSVDNVEVLLCLSAIHSETYNKKMVKKYEKLTDGLMVNHLDQCLDFASLINIQNAFADKEFVFFGTGASIPEDIETASSERLLAEMFNI